MTDDGSQLPEQHAPKRKRRLRAALAADIANFSGRVSVSETRAFGHLSTILKIGREELERHEGDLIGMPGDGLFALFESAVDAVQCALAIQNRLEKETNLGGMRLRIGIHVGDVLFEGDLPFGETLNIAARLESLADPGGILVSGTMVDAVSARIQATFEDRGVPSLKNIPRRITTFAVHSADRLSDTDMGVASTPLDATMQFQRDRSETAQEKPEAKSAATIAQSPHESGGAKQSASEPPSKSLLNRLASGFEPQADASDARSPARTSPSAEEAAAEVRGADFKAPRSAEHDRPEKPGSSPADLPKTNPNAAKSAMPPPPAASLAASVVEEITEALAVHLGPVARIMVGRKAKTATSASDLIEKLATELSSSDERAKFRTRLINLLGR